MYGYENEQTTTNRRNKVKLTPFRIIGAIIILLLLIVGLPVFFNSYTVVNAGHVGVQYGLNGGVKENALPQGWHWHAPTTNVTQFPTSRETVYLIKGKKEDDIGDSFPVNTGDGKSVYVDVTYTYSFEADKTPYIFTRFRRATAETINSTFIKQQLKGAIQSVTTRYSVVEVYGGEKRAEITAAIQKEFAARLEKEGIMAEDFTFQDIRPDGTTLQQIQKIVDAKNQEELLKQQNKNLQQEQVNKTVEAETASKIAIIQSNQAAAQLSIQAEAAAKKMKIDSEAEAMQTITLANAQSEANMKLSASLTDKILQQQLYSVLPNVNFPSTYMAGSGGGGLGTLFNLNPTK